MKKILFLFIATSMVMFSCDDDNDDGEGGGMNTNPVSFTLTIENIAQAYPFTSAGVFNTPDGASAPGAITPGNSYSFDIQAGKKSKLSFATMLAATNDLFYAPKGDGIALYDDNGDPVSGDVTSQVYLWDAGTEVNEEPAVGPNTVTNQSAPNTGEDENGNVRLISDVTTDMFPYPAVSDVIKVTLEYVSDVDFHVVIENVSSNMALQTSQGDMPAPLSPGAWVVHTGADPLFTEGEADRGQGIEGIAEDGDPTNLGAYVSDNNGITYPVSPGAWAVHEDDKALLFQEGSPDYGDGIEGIAEDGDPTSLGSSLSGNADAISSGVFNMPVGSSAAGAAKPGDKYTFTFDAEPGQNLSFATMLAATNDIFFGPGSMGIPLFDSDDMPITGDMTSMITLWDAGTEVNELIGIGPNTVTNQPAPNTGPDENGNVMDVNDLDDGFTYPAVSGVIKVTITTN